MPIIHSLIRCALDDLINFHDLHGSAIIVEGNIIEKVDFLKSFIVLSAVTLGKTFLSCFLHQLFETIIKLLTLINKGGSITYIFE